MSTWALRTTAPGLAERYEADGLWTDETVGELADRYLRRGTGLELRVWSASRPRQSSFEQLYEQARCFAYGLRQRGVDPGDVVAFQLPECEEVAVVVIGAALCGAVIVPIAPRSGPKEAGSILRDSRARILITADRFGPIDYVNNLRRLIPDLNDLSMVALVRIDGQGGAAGTLNIQLLEFTDLLAADPIAGPVHTDASEPALVAYTGGTASDPKGVIHTHRSLVAEIAQLGGIQRSDERPLLARSTAGHAVGALAGLLLPISLGRSIHLVDVWDSQAILDALLEGDRTGDGGTYFLTSLLDPTGRDDGQPADRMQSVASGHASDPASIASRASGIGISVLRSSGSAEHPSVTGSELGFPETARTGEEGRPLAGVEVRIIDRDGKDAPVGERGEILSRGPDLCAGYTDASLTAGAFDDDGWFHSGAVGVLDADGFVAPD